MRARAGPLAGVPGSALARAAILAGILAAVPATARADKTARDGSVYARVSGSAVVLGNALAERRWRRDALVTTALVDKRDGGLTWSRGARDFALRVAGGASVGSDALRVTSATLGRLPRGGLRVTMQLAGAGLSATRTAEAYPGVAGFRMQTVLHLPAPVALAGYTLDEAAVGSGAAVTTHAFHAGADWRGPGESGAPPGVGSPERAPWRFTYTGSAGVPVQQPAEWMSAAAGGRTLFMVAERNDLPSSRASYDGLVADVDVDYARDVISLGPEEEQGHVENPFVGSVGRQRVVGPGDVALEPVFTGLGTSRDDEAWQHFRYLDRHRLAPYPDDVTFNSNGTDDNARSTGAKDDMDLATVQAVAPRARRLGVDTFVLDDGWQAISGDWQPDSPQHPDPRGTYPPRFPDDTFAAVRRAIAPMKLGLWMSPMSFNPASATYRAHPDWACSPVGQGTTLVNLLDPDSGSNEAGIGLWGPAAIPWVESRIRDAIDHWGVTYFKFDFLLWLDCAGQGDLHDYHDAFVAMLDRLRRDRPGVTFQIDETNDYRLFPFESVTRGPTWFQNGTPPPEALLQNLWELSPYVPAFALGQHFLGGDAWRHYPVATLMAAALPSHMTYFSDLRRLPDDVIDAAAPWVAFQKAHRAELAQLTYPLLDEPIKGGWTALQTWDPVAGRGALLAFRQDSDVTARTIALRNVPPGRRYELLRAPDGAVVGRVTSADLRRGLRVELAQKRTARVLVIRPAHS